MNETDLSNKIQALVMDSGGYVLKVHGNAMQRAGEPDLIGAVRVSYNTHLVVVPFAIELKVGTNQPSEIQKYRLSQWQKAFFTVGVTWDVEGFYMILFRAVCGPDNHRLMWESSFFLDNDNKDYLFEVKLWNYGSTKKLQLPEQVKLNPTQKAFITSWVWECGQVKHEQP